ncbi:MAG: NUDIX domain-containing protein [Eubacteriales bacterium]|nr:NUDIX domain-containing protein [Eubacteriales bacterium]
MREPYNVLVLPYCKIRNEIKYCIFLRRDMEIWQFIAGGGENGETAIEAARREAFEEAGISQDNKYYKLTSSTHVPVIYFSNNARTAWGDDVHVIPVYCYATDIANAKITISCEHTDFRWVNYNQATELLHFDIDKTALWELESRLQCGEL